MQNEQEFYRCARRCRALSHSFLFPQGDIPMIGQGEGAFSVKAPPP